MNSLSSSHNVPRLHSSKTFNNINPSSRHLPNPPNKRSSTSSSSVETIHDSLDKRVFKTNSSIMNTAESKIISSPKCHSVDSAVKVGDWKRSKFYLVIINKVIRSSTIFRTTMEELDLEEYTDEQMRYITIPAYAKQDQRDS